MVTAEQYRQQVRELVPSRQAEPDAWCFGYAASAVTSLRERCASMARELRRSASQKGVEFDAGEIRKIADDIDGIAKGEE